jgi:RNA polymerase sigma-70 factor (ECF subfamily)
MNTDAVTATSTDEHLAATVGRRDESPAARRASEAAFRDLYERHARRLLAFLAGRLKSAALDDVHQEVWQRVWQHCAAGFRGGNFRSWLYAIARNCVTDHQRRRTYAAIPEDANVADERQRAADESLIEAELRDVLRQCLKKLESNDAALAELVRARASGESYETICQRTGLPADRAYRAFHQAKAQLQTCVERVIP